MAVYPADAAAAPRQTCVKPAGGFEPPPPAGSRSVGWAGNSGIKERRKKRRRREGAGGTDDWKPSCDDSRCIIHMGRTPPPPPPLSHARCKAEPGESACCYRKSYGTQCKTTWLKDLPPPPPLVTTGAVHHDDDVVAGIWPDGDEQRSVESIHVAAHANALAISLVDFYEHDVVKRAFFIQLYICTCSSTYRY